MAQVISFAASVVATLGLEAKAPVRFLTIAPAKIEAFLPRLKIYHSATERLASRYGVDRRGAMAEFCPKNWLLKTIVKVAESMV